MFEELAEYEAAIRADERLKCAREVEAIGRNEWRNDVVPITRLREFVESERLYDATDDPGDLAHTELLGRLSAFLDGVECASNPNNERTT